MNRGTSTILYPVSDLATAKAIFGTLLGVDPIADAPYYVGFEVAGVQVGLDPSGSGRGMTGATPFWYVDDIAEAVSALEAAGARVVEAAHDVANGLLVAMLKDGDGNMIGVRQTP
jgi:predicted enzyme related to lactoylglutathione lyase